MRILRRLLAPSLVAVLSLASSGSTAEVVVPAGGKADVWDRYLSVSERAALRDIDQMAADGGGEAVPGDPAAALAAMRAGFDQIAVAMAPADALDGSQAYDKDGVKGRWFTPVGANADRVLLYFHGGGFISGNPTSNSAVASALAKYAGIRCFSLDYPLAPEFPYPAQLDSAVAAYGMILEQGIKPENIVLAGDSAGGGLVLTTLVRLRDSGRPLPAGAYLVSPWADLTASLAAHSVKADVDTMLTTDMLRMMASAYAQGREVRSPELSPVNAGLRGLPPILIHAGSAEMLLDDALAVTRNAALADVPVTLSVWPGYFHVFQMFHRDLEGGRRALRAGAAFLTGAIDGTLLR